MSNPRSVALNLLLKIEEDKAYSNLALANAIRENRLGGVDAAFVSALVYGVLERQLTLDYIIKQYSKIPLRKIEIKTKLILRMGILQLLFMDKVPESAAVNESVNLAKKNRLQKSAGFINGILRSITRAEVKYHLPDESDREYYYSIKYSAPRELVRLWTNAYGEENAVKLCENLSGRPPICARVNTLKTDADSLIMKLREEGSGRLERMTMEGICDIAFVTTISKTNRMNYILIENEHLVLIAAKTTNLAQRFPDGTTLDITEARNESFVSMMEGHSVRSIQDTLFERYDLNPRILLETNNMEAAKSITARADAVFLVPSVYVPETMADRRRVNIYQIANADYERHFYLCYRQGMYLTNYQKDLVRIVCAKLNVPCNLPIDDT